ncbi:MAG: DNA repair protein RadC [Deltaproteobacteria bacterium]|nr:DNA repair protein RadC [Deltaproteobacteria bacterium]
MSKTIKDWPEDERPREKLLKRGPESLSDGELLAIILRTGDGTSKQSALDHARALLLRFGSLRKISTAGISEICEIKGIGPAKAATIMAAFEIGRRLSREEIRSGDTFRCSEDVFRHYHSTMRDVKKESFLAILLDSKNKVIREIDISTGSLTASIVHPRELFNPAIKESAAAMILIHNHPSGDPTPSREDIELTKRLREAGELLGIKVLDHIVIGDGHHVSLAEMGYMK